MKTSIHSYLGHPVCLLFQEQVKPGSAAASVVKEKRKSGTFVLLLRRGLRRPLLLVTTMLLGLASLHFRKEEEAS